MRSRRGSSAVFLSVIMAALVTVSLTMITITRDYTAASRADGISRLACSSLLSEFHREILEEYGLFLVPGDGKGMTKKYSNYLTYSLSAMDGIDASEVEASGGRYAVVDPEPVRLQIMAYMKTGGLDLIAGSSREDPDTKGKGQHHLRHGPTIASLPSRSFPEKDLLTSLDTLGRLTDLKEVFTEGTGKYLLGSYVLGRFNHSRAPTFEDHFFRHEAEYILHGRLSDQENLDKTVRALRALRTPSNLAFIYSDPVRRNALITAAEAIAPGPAGVALQAVIAGAWAYAESVNDVALLLEGHRVPAVKTDASWALDVDTVLSSLISGALDPERIAEGEDSPDPEDMVQAGRLRTIHPEEDTGLTYEQYLRVLLFLKDDNVTVMRVLDLVQINARRNFDGEFLICEQSTGLSAGAKINGRELTYERSY